MKYLSLVGVCALVAILSACTSTSQTKQELSKPISCKTAEGDLRALENEKTHAGEQAAAGVTAVVPIGLVVGLVTGTEDEKFRVATGEYNELIDRKIAQIKKECEL